MIKTALQFNKEQFNRLFPFYVMINHNLIITDYGQTLEKLCGKIEGRYFLDIFNINRPEIDVVDFGSLKGSCDQLLIIEVKNKQKSILRGQLELLEATGQILFVGSPWFNSMEDVVGSNLAFLDFAHHDPLIDLLHVLKNQELANDDLKQLLQTVSQQKNDLKKATEEIKRLALVASANENGVVFNNAKGEILWANEGFCKMLGYPITEVIGKNTLDFCKGPLTDDAIIKQIAASVGKIDSFHEELIHYRKDGTWFWGMVKGQSFKTTESNELEYFAIVEDISQEKEKEEQLKILSQIAENNINAVVITDKEGCITWINKSFTNITGYTLAEVVGRKPGHILQGRETDPKTIAYLKTQIDSGQPFNTEILNYSKSGSAHWLRIQGQPITNKKGELTGFFALEENITKEKQIQEQIKESEARFRLVLEKVGDNVWELDLQNGKMLFSKPYYSFGSHYNDTIVEGEALWWNNVHPDDLADVLEKFSKYKGGEVDSQNIEYRIIQEDGSAKWVLDRGVVIEKDSTGKPLRLIGTHTDISKIKQTERELEQRVKQFKSLSDNIPGVIYEYEFRPDGTEGLRYISPAVEQVLGVKPEDFYNFYNYLLPEDLERIRKKNEHSKLTLEPFYDESMIIVPNSSPKWHSVHSSFSYISHSGAKVFTGFMMDITERKNTEVTLQAKEEKYRGIIANMNLGLLEVDNDERIAFANQSFCEMSGFSIEELLNKKASRLFSNGQNARLVEEKTKSRKNGVADAYQVEVKNKNGDPKWWLISGAPRYNDKNELVGSIGIHLDITEQKKLETELITAKTRAENLARTKEIFLANMSHEIRTPMNAIMGMSNQLGKTSLLPQQRFYLEIIHSAADNLLVIINDILDLSKIEAGKLSFEKIGFELETVSKRAIQVLAHKAEEKGINLTNTFFDNDISPILIGDPYRLNQVLLNLMGNAIKFTEKGSVDLVFKLINNTDTSQLIQVDVMDTGVGMDESFVEHLFDKFSQEYESVTRKYGGTGLGMSISKELIELMGGQIFAESKKGEGSKISFVVEFNKGNTKDLPDKQVVKFDPAFLTGKNILITDDNELNRLVASVILQNYNANIIEASSGKQAIEIVNSQKIDIILMDIQMPGMNGFETTKIIKQNRDKIPIIALTAEAINGERDKCISAGMDDYITKPFKEEVFLKIISNWLKISPISSKIEEIEIKMETEKLYDLSTLVDISRGNKAFVQKMVDMFCEQTPPMIKEMEDAFHSNDFEKLSAIAHKIKPSIDNLNIIPLKQMIRNIEKFSKMEVRNQTIPGILDETNTIINKVIEKMKLEYPSV